MLARVSFKFGQLAAGGEADENEMIVAIYSIAKLWPNAAKSRDTIRRAFDAGVTCPRSAPGFLDTLFKLKQMPPSDERTGA
jgi:hypothetical protein